MKSKGIRGGSDAASGFGSALQRATRTIACASIAVFALAAFPALASAIQPVLVGSPSATPTADGAHLTATLYPYGLDTTYRYEYGSTSGYGANIPVPDGDAGAAPFPGTATLPQTITGLASNTTYHFRLVAHNADGTATTADQTFTTTGAAVSAPAVVANAASPIAGGFELSGTVNAHGAATSYRFEYGTSTAYGTSVPSPDGSAGSGSTAAPVAQNLTGLLPNTTYHFRLVAQNSGGTTPSADRTFTTPPSGPAPPVAVANAPTQTAGGFDLQGAINPNGVDTSYHFEFGPTIAYGANLPATDADIGAGSSAVNVFQEVTGLSPNTTYHYRIVAANAEGPGTSADRAFTTPPLPPVVVATPFGESPAGFTLNGTVNPNGGPTAYHFEFGITTAYGSNIPATDVVVGSGSSAVAVTQLVANLPPEVPYHYRLVAHNAGGTTISNDQAFVTPPAPSAGTPAVQLPALVAAPIAIAIAPPAPLNKFSLKPGVAKNGATTMQVNVPGAGTVSASGKLIKPASAKATRAGPVTLQLKLNGKGAAALSKAKSQKLAVKVKFSFQPSGGSAATATRTVTFKQASGR